jgi:hypothetical protein
MVSVNKKGERRKEEGEYAFERAPVSHLNKSAEEQNVKARPVAGKN